MALTMFMCGHGSWKPNSGFITVPKGCSVTFVVHHAKLLPTSDMYRVCGGTYPGQSDRTIGEFQSCPNMTWTADEPPKIPICQNAFATNPGAHPGGIIFPNHYPTLLDNTTSMTLGHFFTQKAADIRNWVTTYTSVSFIWNCCSHVGLTATTKGADIGINAGQGATEYIHLDLSGGGTVPTGKTTGF